MLKEGGWRKSQKSWEFYMVTRYPYWPGQSWKTGDSCNDWRKSSACCFAETLVRLACIPIFQCCREIPLLCFHSWAMWPFKALLWFSFKKGHHSAIKLSRIKQKWGQSFLRTQPFENNRVKGKGNRSCFYSDIQVCVLLDMRKCIKTFVPSSTKGITIKVSV